MARLKFAGWGVAGSRFIVDTAAQKLINVANKALAYRSEQEAMLGHTGAGCKHGEAKKLGPHSVHLGSVYVWVGRSGACMRCVAVREAKRCCVDAGRGR